MNHWTSKFMNIDKSRHRHSHVWSFIRQSDRGIVEAIFADFRNFIKISRYLHGHNSIGLVFTLQKHSILQYFIYVVSIVINNMYQ